MPDACHVPTEWSQARELLFQAAVRRRDRRLPRPRRRAVATTTKRPTPRQPPPTTPSRPPTQPSRPPRKRRRPPRNRRRPPTRRSRPQPATVELAAGDVFVSGSSTVEPISIRVGELADELSGGELKVTVEGPGTGDGFEKFCGGETDISDASRPINDEEAQACADAGIEYVELEVAIDGLTVATNPANADVECLDIPALYALIGPESEGFGNWSDANDLAAEVGSAYGAVPRRPARRLRPRRGERHVRHVRRVRDRRSRRGARRRRGDPRRLHVERQRQPHRAGHRIGRHVARLGRLRLLRRRAGADEGDRDRRRRRLRRADARDDRRRRATRSAAASTST